MSIQELNCDNAMALEKNLDLIRKNIEAAKSKFKSRQDVTILAATKTIPASVINYVTQELCVYDIGENRVQELLEKYDDLILEDVTIHFIGKLQTNKVKYIVDKVDMIHSVDSIKLAKEIDTRCAKIGKVMDILVEINIGREENKSGIMPEEVEEFMEQLAQFHNIRVKGLMTLAPVCAEKEDYRKYFRETYAIFIDNLQKKLHNINMEFLSMGMSGSYDVAVEEGSNIVRIGSALFGHRDYK